MNSTMISNRVLSKLTDKELEYYIYIKHAKEDAKFEVQRAKKIVKNYNYVKFMKTNMDNPYLSS